MTSVETINKFIDKAQKKYPRSYIAIKNETGEIIAHSKDFNKTVKEARKKLRSSKIPFSVSKQPEISTSWLI